MAINVMGPFFSNKIVGSSTGFSGSDFSAEGSKTELRISIVEKNISIKIEFYLQVLPCNNFCSVELNWLCQIC